MTQSLQQLLDSLPEEERIILSLHYLRGIPCEKIASTLGVPAKSVEAVVASGRTRILKVLGIS